MTWWRSKTQAIGVPRNRYLWSSRITRSRTYCHTQGLRPRWYRSEFDWKLHPSASHCHCRLFVLCVEHVKCACNSIVPRPAFIRAQTGLEWPATNASSARIGERGISNTCASVFAAVTPMLRPVHEPGPTTTAMRSRSEGSICKQERED